MIETLLLTLRGDPHPLAAPGVAAPQPVTAAGFVEVQLDGPTPKRGQRGVGNKQHIDVRQVVEQVTDVMTPLFAKRGQRLHVTVPQTPVLMLGDAARLQQVLSNLLTNAGRCSHEGGQVFVHVEVTALHTMTPPGAWRVCAELDRMATPALSGDLLIVRTRTQLVALRNQPRS